MARMKMKRGGFFLIKIINIVKCLHARGRGRGRGRGRTSFMADSPRYTVRGTPSSTYSSSTAESGICTESFGSSVLDPPPRSFGIVSHRNSTRQHKLHSRERPLGERH